LPRKGDKGMDASHHKPLYMHKMYEMCGSLPKRCNANNISDIKFLKKTGVS